mmetsp:Transcript_3600/g.6060  ORF Transcript_3600/g.6060 Transcript_3600/m.6060 type:complete len:202 (+) Transcript_3600:273-878(+)
MAFAIWRQDLTILKHIAAPVRQLEGHAPGQRHVTFAIQDRLRRIMHRHQRGGTRRLHPKAWPVQIQNVAQACGQKVLIVARMTQQEHASTVHQITVGADVEIEIAAHAAATKHANRPAKMLRHVACIFQGFPAHLQKLAVLRIHDRGFFWRQAKKLGVKIGKAVNRGRGGHVVAMCQLRPAFAIGQKLVFAQLADGADAVA